MSENINVGDSRRKTQSNGPFNNKKESENTRRRLWGILIFAVIGATATTFAVAQMRRSAEWFSSQYSTSQSSFKGTTGGSSRSSYKDEARRRYTRRLKEEFEKDMERVERIRRMQSIFNREKNKHRRGYERWREDTSAEYHFYNHFHQDNWYWKTDTTYGNWSNFRGPHQTPANYSFSHHYAVLGLSRSRTTPYTDDEIKTAFRSKAKQYHPDQHQENKEVAEARFKEVMTSYEAIKCERKNMN